MAGGKNNTQRIETLESQAANIAARLDVHDTLIDGITELARKCEDVTQGHVSKITVVEQQLLVLADLKNMLNTVAAIERDLVGIKRDLASLQAWKDEMKREREEKAKRL
jgi:hypothetical protein